MLVIKIILCAVLILIGVSKLLVSLSSSDDGKLAQAVVQAAIGLVEIAAAIAVWTSL